MLIVKKSEIQGEHHGTDIHRYNDTKPGEKGAGTRPDNRA